MAKEDELNDVSLCYQALGIDFGASPEEVERAYQRTLAEIKKNQASPDPAKRAEAAKDLELAHNLYDKIRASVTYNATLSDANKAALLKAQTKKENVQQYKICSSCNRTILATSKKCPYCRELIRTPFEAAMHKLFSGKSLAAIIIILILIVAATLYISFPDIFRRTKEEQPVAAPPDSVIFKNQSGLAAPPASGAFNNQTAAAQKR